MSEENRGECPIDPLTGEPILEEPNPQFDEEAEALFLASRKEAESESDRDAGNVEQPPQNCGDLCGDLLAEPKILSVVDRELTNSGYAGSTWPVLLVVLALFSRHLTRPVSIVLRGESSAGKSYAIRRALDFISPEGFYTLTSMSPKALYYDDVDLKHKVIVVFEGDGLKDEVVAYAMRSLLSEGQIKYQYTDVETKKVVKLEREGPTGLVTSTAGRVDYELGTRIFSVPIDDSPEVTKEIMLADALKASGAAPISSLQDFAAFDRFLELNRKPVLVPYAKDLAENTDGRAVRMRRDFASVLGLIQTHALMHQRTREIDDRGHIVANAEDYECVFSLVADLVAFSSERSVPPEIRETVDLVWEKTSRNGQTSISARKVAEALGIHRTTASRRLNRAKHLGYVAEAPNGGRSQAKSYVHGDGMPGDRGVLPDPEELFGK